MKTYYLDRDNHPLAHGDASSWDRFYLGLCEEISKKSKDPSTKLGVVLVRPDRTLLSVGFNGFPRGVRETQIGTDVLDPERWEKRPEKYRWVEHAERNAIYNAARNGVSTIGCYMYINAHPTPCADCTRAVIQAGIVEVIGLPQQFRGKGVGTHYHCGDIETTMLHEADIRRRVVEFG